MRYRTRRAAWRIWLWFWGGLLAVAWPVMLPLGSTGKTVALAVWWCVALPAIAVFRLRKLRRR